MIPSMGMSLSSPLRMTRAVLGRSSMSRWMAAEVFPLAPASSRRPRMMSVTMKAAP